MNVETAPEGGSGNPAGTAGYVLKSTVEAWCRGVIENTITPDAAPTALGDLWRDGFIAGALAVRATTDREIARLQHDVNAWYVRANYTPEQVAEMRRKASYLQANINWETGVIA